MRLAGHVFDRIRRSEADRALLRKRHELHAEQRQRYTGSRAARPTEMKSPGIRRKPSNGFAAKPL